MADSNFKTSLLNVADGVIEVANEKYVAKEAGKGLFSGKYEDLTGTPDLDGYLTEEDLTEYATEQYVDDKAAEVEGKIPGNATTATAGIVKGDGTTIETKDGVANVKDGVFAKATDITDFVTGTVVEGMLEGYVEDSDIADMATNTSVDNKLKDYAKSAAVTQEIEEATQTIEAKVTGVFKYKGSVALSALPQLSADVEGFVYNINETFVTNANFVEGANKSYPAGTNVVAVEETTNTYKWDVFPGPIDTSDFLTADDIETVTKEEVVAHLKG